MPHPNLNQGIGVPVHNPQGPEGFYLGDLAEGTILDIETKNRHYRLVKRSDTRVHLSGHPTLCPEPIEVEFQGSFGTGSLSAPDPGFIGRGMYLVFKHPSLEQVIATSRILDIHKVN